MRFILWLAFLLTVSVGAHAQCSSSDLAACPTGLFNSVQALTIDAAGGTQFGLNAGTSSPTQITGGSANKVLVDLGGLLGEVPQSALTIGGTQISAGTLPPSALTSAITTVNGVSCTLGGSNCSVTATATSITGGSTTIVTCTNQYLLYNNAGTLGCLNPTGLVLNGDQLSATTVPNSALVNAGISINGVSCTLGGTCTITSSAGTITGGSTSLVGGTNGYLLSDSSGVLGYTNPATLSISGTQITSASLPNAALAHPATTVNGQTCTLGSTCTVTTAAASLSTATTITGGSNGFVLYDNNGVLGYESLTAALTSTITQTATGNFFLNTGANINRLNDRALVGTATLITGNSTFGSGDWTQTQYSGIFGYLEGNAQFAVGATHGELGIVAVVRSSDGTAGNGVFTQGLNVVAVNDNTTSPGISVAGIYSTVARVGNAPGPSTLGMESDVENAGPVSPPIYPSTPYGTSAGLTANLWLPVGGELAGQSGAGYTFNPVNAAIVILQNNPANYAGVKYNAGIVFAANALDSNNVAMMLETGHQFNWYNSSNFFVGAIAVSATTTATGQQIAINDSGFQVLDMGGRPQIQINNTIVSADNWLLFSAAAGTNSPTLSANSASNANVALTLTGKGNAPVVVRGASDGSSAGTGIVGEYLSAETTGYAGLANNAVSNLISMVLTPGDWDVWGNVGYQTGTFNVSAAVAWITPTSGVRPSGFNNGGLEAWVGPSGGAVTGTAPIISAGFQRMNVNTNTTIYCETLAQFSGSMGGHCFMAARRRR